MLRKLLVLLIMFGITISFSYTANSATDEVKRFIMDTSERTLGILNGGMSDSDKQERLEDLFRETVDIAWIGRFVLGKNWRGLTEVQKADYMALYSQYLIQSYVPNFKKYTGEKLVVKSITPGQSNEYLVDTAIVKDGGPEIRVGYQVRYMADQNRYKVFDIIGEGVSLIVTQRSEFASIIERNGIDYLNDQLEQKMKLSKSPK